MTRNRSLTSILALSFTSLLGAAACNSQVDGDHPGDSLASIGGTIVNERAQAPAQAYTTLMWLTEDNAGRDSLYAEAVAVQGNFPAQFQLDLYQPPADSVLFDLGPDLPKFGYAYIAVFDVPPEELDLSNEEAINTHLLGIAENNMVVYVDQALEAGPPFENVRGSLTAGYNTMDVHRLTQAELGQIEQCHNQATTDEERAACGSFFDVMVPALGNDNVQVRLVDDVSLINFPNVN